MFDLRVCRCCLSTDAQELPPGNSYGRILDILTGNELEMAEAMLWLCQRCCQTMRRISQFRDMCWKANNAFKEYSSRHSEPQMSLEHFKHERIQLNELTRSNTLSINVLTGDFVSPAQIFSTSRDSNPPKNYTEDMDTISSLNFAVKLEPGVEIQFAKGETIDNFETESNDFETEDRLGYFNEDTKYDSETENLNETFETHIKGKKKSIKNVRKVESKVKLKRKAAAKTPKKPSPASLKKKKSSPSGQKDKNIAITLTLEEQIKEKEDRALEKDYIASPFKCAHCVVFFNHQYLLDDHMKKHDESRGELVCAVCTQRFSDQKPLYYHCRNHATRLACSECGSRFRKTLDLRDHLAWHAGTTFPCHVCGKLFTTSSALKIHITILHKEKDRLKCDLCGKGFYWKKVLKEHILRHGTVRPHPCPHCPKAFYTPVALRSHIARHLAPLDTAQQHYCVECNKHYKSEAILLKHLKYSKRHADQATQKFVCPHCERRFVDRYSLASHVNTIHERVPTDTCLECGTAFYSRHALNRHNRSAHQGHEAPRNHKCSYCHKAFKRKTALEDHKRTHTGERPFECALCHLNFAQRTTLDTHIKIVHLKIKRNVPFKQATEFCKFKELSRPSSSAD